MVSKRSLSLMTTLVMMTGNIEYIDTYVNPLYDGDALTTLPFSTLAFIMLAVFIILMPILLMNLLVSLLSCPYYS